MGLAADVFHKHLDRCRQCRENPFDLCPIGDSLLKLAGDEEIEGSATGEGPADG